MAIKKVYVSDLSGDAIDGKPVTLTLQRTVTKRNSWGTYRSNEAKKLHLTEAEAAALFNAEIRQWLGFEKAPAPVADAKKKA